MSNTTPIAREAIIVFLKEPIKGEVKTRLAASIGEDQAVDIYRKLLDISRTHLKDNGRDVFWYINKTPSDTFRTSFFSPNDKIRIQKGADLGEKMSHAFKELFSENYDRICIMGTDCPFITKKIIDKAFQNMSLKDTVLGPAEDGGYYLLGMVQHFSYLFNNVSWSTGSVLKDTMNMLHQHDTSYALLEELYDIDEENDARRAGLLC